MEYKARCFGSLLFFTQTFFNLRTAREFKVSEPIGREPHIITICRALFKVFNGEYENLIIQIPPRYGKSTMIIHFVAWCLARYPDCNFLYLSYSHSLASKQTETIREIVSMPYYRKMFDIKLSESTSAKDHFETTKGGAVYASGFGGSIVGFGAGIRGISDRFGGCIIIDDAHKPDEVSSDTIREGVIDNYINTIPSRRNNGVKTPIIAIAQSLHEDDLMERLKRDSSFHQVILPALDDAGNALAPDLHSREDLIKMRDTAPYFFASQMQQCPQPAGGGLFKPEWFPILDVEPKILATFITADTAETEKTFNDATAFSFWGIYKIVSANQELDLYGIHWLHAVELWCEPKDLEAEFLQFFAQCMRYAVKPQFAAIEKKSTGVTLCSLLERMQGLRVLNIERNRGSNKMDRFIGMQTYIGNKQVSLPYGAQHTKMCVEHMRKITANDTHARDDLADNCCDAIKIALIDKTVLYTTNAADKSRVNAEATMIMSKYNRINNLRRQAFGGR